MIRALQARRAARRQANADAMAEVRRRLQERVDGTEQQTDDVHLFAATVTETWITAQGIDRATAQRIREGIRIYTACLEPGAA